MPTAARFNNNGDLMIVDGELIEGYKDCLSFDANGDYVLCGSTMNTGLTDVTFECWFNATAWSSWGAVIGNFNYTLNKGINIIPCSATLIRIMVGDGVSAYNSTSSASTVTLKSSISLNTWYHVAVVYTSSTTTIELFLNGVSQGTVVRALYAADTITSIGTWAGNYPTGYVFNGMIRDCRQWNIPRTAAQILANMNEDVTGQNGLIGYWKCNDTYSTTLTDYSGNGYHGTITGAVRAFSGVGPFSFLASNGNSIKRTDTGSIYVPVSTLVNPAAFTFDFLVMNAKNGNWVSLVNRSGGSWGTTAGDLPWIIGYNTTGDLWVSLNTTNGITGGYTGVSLVEGIPYRITVSYDPTIGLKVYINGILKKSYSTTGDIVYTNAIQMQFCNNLIGQLYFMRMYNRALTASEVLSCVTDGIVPSSSLIGEWLFEEESGTTAYDTSGNLLHASLNAALVRIIRNRNIGVVDEFVEDRKDTLVFSGLNGLISIPATTTLNPASITIESRFKWDGYRYAAGGGNDWFALCCVGDSQGVTNGYTILIGRASGNTTNEIRLYVSNVSYVSYITTLDTNEHNIAGTFDGTTASIILDGVVVATKAITATITATSLPASIGGKLTGATNYSMGGSIRGLAIWNYAKTLAQVKTDFDSDLATGNETGLIGLWKMLEEGGNYVYDLTSNSNHGTISGGITRTYSGASGITSFGANNKMFIAGELQEMALNHIQFTGTDGYGNTAYNPIATGDITNVVTLEAWAKLNTSLTSTYQTLVSNFEGGGFGIEMGGDYKPYFQVYVGGAYVQAKVTTALTSDWYHFAGVYNSTNLYLYVNGVLQATVALTGNIGNSGQPLSIGSNPPGASTPWRGWVRDVRLWNIARTQAQIQDSMNSELTGTETGLIGYWKCRESYGTKLYDSSPKANHATLTGSYQRLFI